MANHPNRSNISYPTPAPVFAATDRARIIGQARTAAEALEIYHCHYAGSGRTPVKARKARPNAGWIPEFGG
jgi:hypothetical protein